MPGRIRTLAKNILTDPQQINIAISQPAAGIDQQIYRLHDQQKTPLLKVLLKDSAYASSIIFASRKEIVKSLIQRVEACPYRCSSFPFRLATNEREEILLRFKNKKLPVIIGTDALSRGIDVEGIDLVVNYDVPGDPEDYVHRIGRTARAATTGTAITFVNDRDLKRLKSIEQLIDKPIDLKELPEELKGIEQVKQEHPHGGARNDQRRKPKTLQRKQAKACCKLNLVKLLWSICLY
jgi:ATP-dependent RNA helicase RhlE